MASRLWRGPPIIKVKRTPVGGGATTTIEASPHKQHNKLLKSSVRLTQESRSDEASITVENPAGDYSDWEPGDEATVYAQGEEEEEEILTGVIGYLRFDAGPPRRLQFNVVGYGFELDAISLAADRTYESGGWRDALKDLVEQVGDYVFSAGGSTSNPTLSRVVFPKGMKLREAVDICARAIYAAGDPFTVRYRAYKSGGSKKFEIGLNATTYTLTPLEEDTLAGSTNKKGDLLETANRVTVRGAEVAQRVIDKTGVSKAGAVRLDADNDLVAQPFTAQTTPLASFKVKGARSKIIAMPTINVYVARNGDNADQATGFTNASIDVTNPANVNDGNDATAATVATTGGSVTKELARFDMASARAVAKTMVRHSVSADDALLTIELQKSPDGSAWTTLAILDPAISTTESEVFIEEDDFRHVRWVLKDDRAGASPSVTTSCYTVKIYYHTATFGSPLVGDKLKGSSQTLTEDRLTPTPGTTEKLTWSPPRLALTTGRLYWIVLDATGGGANSWFEADYGTEAGATAAKSSTDGGTVWANVAANAVLLYALEFNIARPEATVNDSTSQTKYAGLVPGGVLATAITDDSLLTQDAVDKEANGILKVRKDANTSVSLTVFFDPAAVPQGSVTLDLDVATKLGLTPPKAYDIYEVSHELGPAAKTRFTLNQPEPGLAEALINIARVASQRRY